MDLRNGTSNGAYGTNDPNALPIHSIVTEVRVEPLADEQLQPAISHWNAKDWAKAASSLEALESSAGTLLPIVRHIRGIAANFLGQYALAKGLFQSTLDRWDGTPESMGDLERAAAHWLGINGLCLRKWDDAAVAFAISCSRVTMLEGDPTDAESQALLFITNYNRGSYIRRKDSIAKVVEAISQNHKTGITVLPQIPLRLKADFLAAAAKHTNSELTKEVDQHVSFTERSSLLTLSTSSFRQPWTNPLLSWDPFLLLDPRKFNYHAELGNPVARPALTYRFLGKEHFPGINLTALHTTKRSLPFLVDAVCSGLAARGFVARQYWDRIRAVRIRAFGVMDNVASFVIVVHKWYIAKRLGVQIPAALIRDDWRAVRTPGAHLYLFPSVCAEVKKILVVAEAEAATVDGQAAAEEDEEADEVRPMRAEQRGDSDDAHVRSASTATDRRSLLGRISMFSGSSSRRTSTTTLPTSTQQSAEVV